MSLDLRCHMCRLRFKPTMELIMAEVASSLTIVQQLNRCTARIETDRGSVGTGFFFMHPVSPIQERAKGASYPLLITNAHVVKGASRLKLIVSVTRANGVDEKMSLDEPISSMTPTFHPAGIDLVSLNLGRVLQRLESEKIRLDVIWLEPSIIPSMEQMREFAPLSEIVMVGYPNGIWDEVNNLPVFRKGITATDASIKWNGREEFLMDMAVFGGSSGSPVFIYSEGSFSTSSGLAIGSRLWLIGVNRGVYEAQKDGVLHVIDTPTEKTVVPRTGLPINLGVCISCTAFAAMFSEISKPMPISNAFGGYSISFAPPTQ